MMMMPFICSLQCAGGLEGGATRCAQLLNMLHDLPTDDQDPDDPVTFINTDIKAVFQEMCRQASFDTLTGKATLYNHTMMGGCSLAMTSPPLKNYVLSLDTSTPCTAPPPTTIIVITAGTPITSKAQLAISSGWPGDDAL